MGDGWTRGWADAWMGGWVDGCGVVLILVPFCVSRGLIGNLAQ